MNKHNTPPVNTFDQSQDKDILFSYFKGRITNTRPDENVNLLDVYTLIKSDKFAVKTTSLRKLKGKAASDFKSNNFDYVTFAGSFSIRNDSSLVKASGLFVIDIDHVGERLQELRQRIIDDKILRPQLVFISPSGDGLKTVIRIDASLIDYKADSRKVNDVWQAVNSYFSKHYSDIIIPSEKDFIDPANKDISRACFLCHDADVYLNVNENVTVNSEFIKEFPALMTPSKPSVKKAADQVNRGTASPSIKFESLAEKHLKESDNHHDDLLKFIGAAKSNGKPADQTLNFILNNVKIDARSSRNSPEMVQDLVNDVYSRYGTDSEGIVYLTQKSFAYSFLYFNHQGNQIGYVFSNLFQTEVRNILHKAGYFKRRIGKGFISIQKNGCIIKEVSLENIKDYMTKVVDDINEDICFTYQDNYYQICPAVIKETYLRNSNNIFNKNWMQHLKEFTDPEIKDTESESYFYFNNAFVTVSKEGIRHEQWDDKKGFCIWEDQIIKHDFELVEDYSESHFFNFLCNVTNDDENRLKTMMTGIGYLLHHHFKISQGQAVILYDESITDLKTPQGGSGKGIIIQAINKVRNVTKIDGKHLSNDNKFKWEQITPSTQVVWLDDVKPEFDFSILHSNLTDGWTIERKNVPQFTIDPKDSPKTVITSNSIIKGEGSTNIRRQFVIELSDFYSKKIIKGNETPIETYHGGMLFGPELFTKNEWDMFFSLMLACSRMYFKHGLLSFEGINIKLNRFRQATNEDFVQWCEGKEFETGKPYITKDNFTDFVNTYYGPTHTPGQRTFTGWLHDYAKFMTWDFNTKQSNSITYFMFSEKCLSS